MSFFFHNNSNLKAAKLFSFNTFAHLKMPDFLSESVETESRLWVPRARGRRDGEKLLNGSGGFLWRDEIFWN